MIALTATSGLIGRPSVPWLFVATLFVIAGWALHSWLDFATRPAVPIPDGDARPEPLADGVLEPPAVVGLLTSGYQVFPGAVPATVLDLASRGWLRTTIGNGHLFVVTETRPPVDDGLTAYEQHVVGYLGSLSSQGAVSATALSRSRRMNRRWMLKFQREVADTAASLGLTVDRYRPSSVGSVAILLALGVISLGYSLRRSTDVDIADSWRSRGWWLIIVAALVALLVATVQRWRHRAQTPTPLGQERSRAWLGYRTRLDSRIPDHASVVGSAHQQRALADGVVMGVAPMVYKQLPIIRRGTRWGWSTAGGNAHTVHIRYPIRPGYGRHPYAVAVVGVVGFFVTRWVREFLLQVADGSRFGSTTDSVPGTDIVRTVIGSLAVLMIVPLIVSIWCVIAGVIDAIVSRDHIGVVVRAHTPAQVLPRRAVWLVQPFAARTNYLTYIAVDTGRHPTIDAWLTTGSKAAPQGSGVRARVSLLLGYVHSCEPIARSEADNSGAIPRPRLDPAPIESAAID